MKKSKLLLSSGILGSLYVIYLISYFLGSTISTDGAEAVGGAIAAVLVAPHMLLVGLAVIFTWIGWAMSKRWAALVSGILYSVSILAMPLYALFVVIQLIFSFVAYAKMKKTNPQAVN